MTATRIPVSMPIQMYASVPGAAGQNAPWITLL